MSPPLAAVDRPAGQPEPTLRAPADRSGWRRGFRGLLACAAMVAAPLSLLLSHGTGDRWTYDTGNYTLDYTLEGPRWVGAALVAVAVVLVAAAALLWTARRLALVQLGFALLALAGVGWWVATDAHFGWGRLPAWQLRPVGVGASRAEVRDALRSPAGYGTFRRHGGDQTLDCEIYVKAPLRGKDERLAFCFRDDRVVKRIRW